MRDRVDDPDRRGLIGLVAWRGAAFGPKRGTFRAARTRHRTRTDAGRPPGRTGTLSPVTVPVVIGALVLIGTTTLVTVWAGYCATLVAQPCLRHGWFLGLSTAVLTYTHLGWFTGGVPLVPSLWPTSWVRCSTCSAPTRRPLRRTKLVALKALALTSSCGTSTGCSRRGARAGVAGAAGGAAPGVPGSPRFWVRPAVSRTARRCLNISAGSPLVATAW